MIKDMIGKKVIIRAARAGVFFGTLVEKNGSEVELKDCRRIWYWSGASSISQLALDGTSKPNDCKFTVTIEKIVILGVIEILKTTEKSIESIEGVSEWKQ